jgi:7-cyano-7-deazaguanine reductase
MSNSPSKEFVVFENPRMGRKYNISIDTDEFTALCPMTGQPDFATIKVDYVPDKLCVELKSLKLYFWSFRNEGAYHEDVTNQICDDLVKALDPHSITITGDFNIRGGLRTVVTVTHKK